jgi:hypothetical protein
MHNEICGARRKENNLLISSFLIGISSVSSSSSELNSSSPESFVDKARYQLRKRKLPSNRF